MGAASRQAQQKVARDSARWRSTLPSDSSRVIAHPRSRNSYAAPSRSSADILVAQRWRSIRERLQGQSGDALFGHWLQRLKPVAVRDGALVLTLRGARASGFVQQRYGGRIAEAASSVMGTPIRVLIQPDSTLGGVLAGLGLPLPSGERSDFAETEEPAPFVVRPETKTAFGTLSRFARQDDLDISRVTLFGPSGVGKSHLLNVFQWQRRRRAPQERILRLRGLDLFRSFQLACRRSERSPFRGDLLARDGLILDDVHELAGKLRCQELVVEVLDHLRSHGRWSLLATRELPKSGQLFLPELRSRLRESAVMHLAELSSASRTEVLRSRCAAARHEVPGWFIEQLGRHSALSLNQAFERCQRVASVTMEIGRPPTRDELILHCPDVVPDGTATDPVDRLLDRCAEFVGVSREDIQSGKRTRAASLGRHLTLYLAMEVYRYRRASLCRWFGDLSPSIRSYVVRKIEKLRSEDHELDGFIRQTGDEITRGQPTLFD